MPLCENNLLCLIPTYYAVSYFASGPWLPKNVTRGCQLAASIITVLFLSHNPSDLTSMNPENMKEWPYPNAGFFGRTQISGQVSGFRIWGLLTPESRNPIPD
jgi:hypothetical protein